MEIHMARAQAAEKAAREAYVVETEAEDASRLADGAAKRLAVDMEELAGKMKLRLRWVLSCEKRARRSETADWRKKFAVPEGVGATKIRATCRSVRGAFGASWRRLEEATLALGRVQNFASHLAWQWHTAMEGARVSWQFRIDLQRRSLPFAPLSIGERPAILLLRIRIRCQQ